MGEISLFRSERSAGGVASRIFPEDRSGASAVEFAIVAPVLLAMLLGMLAYGIYLSADHSVRQLAADVARETIAGIDDEERIDIAEAFVATNADRYPLIDPSFITVSAMPDDELGGQFVVTISYDASHLPIWNMAPFVPMPGKVIIGSFTIRSGEF